MALTEKSCRVFSKKKISFEALSQPLQNLMDKIIEKANFTKYEDGEPVEVVPIDYQCIDYGCPIRDLAFFIFSGTDRELRREHLDDLKELYFETLSRFLKYFNMDVETVFPRKEFEKVYTEWLDYGLMMTLFISVALFAPDAGLDFENLSYKDLPFCPDKKCDDILRGLVDDFIQWGYL